jgi:hypothetical protein
MYLRVWAQALRYTDSPVKAVMPNVYQQDSETRKVRSLGLYSSVVPYIEAKFP